MKGFRISRVYIPCCNSSIFFIHYAPFKKTTKNMGCCEASFSYLAKKEKETSVCPILNGSGSDPSNLVL